MGAQAATPQTSPQALALCAQTPSNLSWSYFVVCLVPSTAAAPYRSAFPLPSRTCNDHVFPADMLITGFQITGMYFHDITVVSVGSHIIECYEVRT